MMFKSILAIATGMLMAVHAMPAINGKCASNKIALRADTGNFVSRCNGCAWGAAYPDQVTMHITTPAGNPWAQWTVHDLAGGKVALQADTGRFLSRCNGCLRGAYPDTAFPHATDKNEPYVQWTAEYLPNGKVAFKADTGKYLARCNGCVTGGATPDFAFVHASTAQDAWAQFDVICL